MQTDRQLGMTFAEMREANARLIEQRDELLAALRGVVRIADRRTVEFDAAHAVLDKHESGESC